MKRPRTARNPRPRKKAKSAFNPKLTKQAATIVDPHSYKDQCPAWRFRFVDEEGPWAITGEQLTIIIRDHLKGIETTTWSEIENQVAGGHKRNHSQDVATLSKIARNRWNDLKLDYDTVFRFRFGSRKRLWGVRSQNVFKPVWWDTDHSVYPTEKR